MSDIKGSQICEQERITMKEKKGELIKYILNGENDVRTE